MSRRKTTPRKTQAPAIPEIAQTPEAVHRALLATKEAIEIGYGRRGDPADRFATLRDLRDGGLADLHAGPGGQFSIGVPGGGGGAGGAPTRPGEGDPNYGEDDYTRPLAPTGVRARSIPPDTKVDGDETVSDGIVMVTWDPPGYHNHHYAEVYRMPAGATPGEPSDPSVPVFDIGNELTDPHRPIGAQMGEGEVNALRPGSNVHFVGTANGTIMMDTGLSPLSTGGDELDNALSPGTYYYWVRFVSRARVPGPVSDRAGAGLSMNPTRVLDLMTRNVTSSAIFRNLREWLALGSDEALQGGSILEYINHAIEDGMITSIWSVRMQHQTTSGLTFAAGFGLSMETDNETGESLSTFLVNANQFAVMGDSQGTHGSRATSLRRSGSNHMQVTLQSWQHGFSAGDKVVLSIPSGQIGIGESEVFDANVMSSASGAECEVVSASGQAVTIARLDGTFPQPPGWMDAYSGQYRADAMDALNAAVLPASNIPFIVDTVRNVVGIRGSLVVDGLVRATEGEFDELIANTAYIKHMQAEVVNANVVIGQRLIAGTPGMGAITNQEVNEISNYIVELSNPVTSPYPFRIYKPHDPITGQPHSVFDVSNQGDLYVGGHMTVRKAAVIRGQPENNGGVLFSSGGKGADTVHDNYALWIGPESHYGSDGGGRREENAIMWVKSSGRAGFNADVFLEDNPITIPSGNGYITVKPTRTGQPVRVFVSATFSLIGTSELSACAIGANLYLMPASFQGPGAGPTRSGVGFDPSQQYVDEHVGWYGWLGSASAHTGPELPQGARRVAGLQVDSRVKSSDVKSRAIQGAITVPAGDYKVFLVLWQKREGNSHGCYSFHPFAMQVGDVAAEPGAPYIPYPGDGGEPVEPPPGSNPPPSPPEPPGPPDPPGFPVDPLSELPRPMGGAVVEGYATEDLFAGAFVHLTQDASERPMVELASGHNTTNKRAHGFILDDALDGDKVTIYTSGINDKLSGLEVGEPYILTRTHPGRVIKASQIGIGTYFQEVGIAIDRYMMDVRPLEPRKLEGVGGGVGIG